MSLLHRTALSLARAALTAAARRHCRRHLTASAAVVTVTSRTTKNTTPLHATTSWEICVSATDGQFQQVSFVNSICTSKGGTHVDYLVNQISK